MNPIPSKLRRELNNDPLMHDCILTGLDCIGKIEWHHVFTYTGKQIQEKWNILPLCEYHHRGPGFDNELFQLIALERATKKDLDKYPRCPWKQKRKYLQGKIYCHKIIQCRGKSLDTLEVNFIK